MRRPQSVFAASGILLLAGAPIFASALTIRAGLAYGPRGIADSRIDSTYHPGAGFYPQLEIGIGGGLVVGIGFETSAAMAGTLGLYKSPALFRLSGLDVYARYELRMKSFAAYIQGGYGLYFYKQTVDYPYVQDLPVDGSASTVQLAAGLKYYPWKFLFLSAGAKFVPLRVKPYDQSVDLSGWRFLAGLGAAFDF